MHKSQCHRVDMLPVLATFPVATIDRVYTQRRDKHLLNFHTTEPITAFILLNSTRASENQEPSNICIEPWITSNSWPSISNFIRQISLSPSCPSNSLSRVEASTTIAATSLICHKSSKISLLTEIWPDPASEL